MITLNLKVTTPEETIIKEYLEANVSEMLADKINNGVPIVKDGKTLINKKDLDGFMQYACEEAQKLAAKGARSACIKSDTVLGWAVHYFEESSIEGKLFNEDGTEYKPPAPVKTESPTSYVPAKPKAKPQMTLFDLMDTKTETPESDEPEEIDEPDEEDNAFQPNIPLDLRQIGETEYIDNDGVLYNIPAKTKEIPSVLSTLFGDTLKVR